MKAIIAAGGSGTRLRPLTFSSNKHLLPVANKPLIMYVLDAIAATGIKEIGIIVNETKQKIMELLADGSKWGLSITYIDQPEPLGLAHVVKISEKFLAGEPFVFQLGDNIFTKGIKRPFEHFNQKKPNALLTLIEHEENFRLGVPFFDNDGKLIKVVEKPENPPNKFGVPGLYFFDHHVFEAFKGKDAIKPSARGELEITELYTYMIDHGYTVDTEQLDGQWLDPGKLNDMLGANAAILDLRSEMKIDGEIDKDSTFTGYIRLGNGSRIVNSKLIGPVDIDEQCLIQDSVIGPHVSIGRNSKIQSIVMENSVVLQDTTMFDVSRRIMDSMIGGNTEVWEEKQDSVSLFIGDHCKVRLT